MKLLNTSETQYVSGAYLNPEFVKPLIPVILENTTGIIAGLGVLTAAYACIDMIESGNRPLLGKLGLGLVASAGLAYAYQAIDDFSQLVPVY